MKPIVVYFFLILTVFTCISCNNSADTSVDFEDSTTTTVDTAYLPLPDTLTVTPFPADSTGTGIDTSAPNIIVDTPVNNSQDPERTAFLGYSFFKKMKQNETRRISAYVLINHPESEVAYRLEEINEDHIPVRKSDTVSYFTENINLYQYLDISLKDPDNDFKIDTIHDAGRQLIDTINGNRWEWMVTPKTAKKQVRLILKVVGENTERGKKEFETKTIPIDISLELNFWRKIWTWLQENPEKFLVLILIPIVTYFANTFFKKKKKE